MNLDTFRILITPDKFRGSLNATQVCQTIQKALIEFQQNDKECPKLIIQKLQLSDGGEGTLQILNNNIPNLKLVQTTALDPLFRQINTRYLIDNQRNIAYLQMAQISGLSLLTQEQRNPFKTSTLGLGQIIKSVLFKNITRIYLFIGGSATNDAGIGMASALGYKFLDQNDNQLQPIGQNLIKINHIIFPSQQIIKKIDKTDIYVISDVQNPFYGPNGAAYIYSPQKGATQEQVITLDQGLSKINSLFIKLFKVDLQECCGSGAAGGLGGGAKIFLKAKMEKGIEKIMDILKYNQKVQKCDLVITGQGKLDKQSLEGKVVMGVLRKAKEYSKKLWILCGINQLDIQKQLIPMYTDIQVISLVQGNVSIEQAIKNVKDLIRIKIKKAFNNFLLNKTKNL